MQSKFKQKIKQKTTTKKNIYNTIDITGHTFRNEIPAAISPTLLFSNGVTQD